ncbi:MAG: beta-lactamase family protein [Candidatus Brockarchaeota archaeon]|nr:beta-lactamase family protein [Candidatus Brockarchaeota archaeon]
MGETISRDAKRLGFDESAIGAAFRVLRSAVDSGIFPGYVALVARKQRVVARSCHGWRMLVPERREMGLDTIFDVASLTKVVVTTTALMKLVEEGKLRLGDRVSEILEEFSSEKQKTITVKHLLTHTSGLPAWIPFFKKATGREEVLRLVLATDPEFQPGTREVYSDLNFILLGTIVERTLGKRLDAVAKEKIFLPLGMKDSFFNPPRNLWGRIAATEEMKQEPRSGKVVLGEVHDENAYAMGGVAGHAGLFTTADDLARFCAMVLGLGTFRGKRILAPGTVRLMTRCQNQNLGGCYGLGWMTNKEWDAGELFSELSFGHTGFTGTSVWMDPEIEVSTVLLTNAVHPSREHKSLASVRARFNNAVAASIGEA